MTADGLLTPPASHGQAGWVGLLDGQDARRIFSIALPFASSSTSLSR
jgi:hypothetical protein